MLPSAQREAQEAEGLKDMLRDRVEKACSAAGFWNASGDNLVFSLCGHAQQNLRWSNLLRNALPDVIVMQLKIYLPRLLAQISSGNTTRAFPVFYFLMMQFMESGSWIMDNKGFDNPLSIDALWRKFHSDMLYLSLQLQVNQSGIPDHPCSMSPIMWPGAVSFRCRHIKRMLRYIRVSFVVLI